MKANRFIIPAAAILLLAGQAAAQSHEEAERAEAAAAAAAEAAEAKAETREAEIARKLEEAERRMAEAARQIAELTSERLPQLEEMERRFEFYADGRPRLGVNIGKVKNDGPVEGVKIVGVSPGSAADDAGLRAGDIITAINGDSMGAESAGEASRLVLDFMQGVEAGDILEVEYIRDGKVGSVEVEPRAVEMHAYAFGGVPKDFSMPAIPDIHVTPEDFDDLSNKLRFVWPGSVWADMELVELNEGLGKYFGTDSGVLVVSAPESDSLQLEDGDVIVSIDGREPTTVRHTLRILGSYQPGESLEIQILREKRKRTLEIEIPDDRSSMMWAPRPSPRPAVAPRPAAAPKRLSEKT
jgi:C-terminal processing protease CtpA/Prc